MNIKLILLLLGATIWMYSCKQDSEKQSLRSPSKTSQSDEFNLDKDISSDSATESNRVNSLNNTVFMQTSWDTIRIAKLRELVAVLITDSTNKEIIVGEHYYVEKLSEGRWNRIPDNRAFEDRGYIVKEGRTLSFDIDLRIPSYSYEPGKYRIKKNYSVKIREYGYDKYEPYSEIIIE